MKLAAALSLATVSAGFVLPDPEIFSQVAIHDHEEPHEGSARSWADKIPSTDSVAAWLGDALDYIPSAVKDGLRRFDSTLEDELVDLADDDEDDEDDEIDIEASSWDRPGHGHHGHHGHKTSNLTLWQHISKSNNTTKFAKLVAEHPAIVELLNSTEANRTLFVPVDAAFENIPDHHKKPSDEFVEALLRYHIGVDAYPAHQALAAHTLPTLLDESWIGGKPQRLRTRVGLRGWRLNFYSKVVAANFPATNGIIHAINHILVPPPLVGRELTLFPSRFSTLLLAYEKTDFVKYIHGLKINGSTVFAPSNDAFARLGPGANAFLFNTEKGLKYLQALLKYHIVANTTLYSDEIYRDDKGDETDAGIGDGHTHIDLPSLLDDKSIAVDIARWKVFIRVRVNGYVPVVVQDGVAKNGVIHVVGRVLIPPHEHKHEKDDYDGGEISVEELTARLVRYVEEDGAGGIPEVTPEELAMGEL